MVLSIFIFLFQSSLFAQPFEEKSLGIQYFVPILGHVHQSPDKVSVSLTTIQCGHPVEVLASSKVKISDDWKYVRVADYRGFISTKFLSTKREECFISSYPRFFDAFSFDLTELYFWGRLYDHYVMGDSQTPQ